MANKQRIYLTAISCVGGILSVLSPEGNVIYFRQRGIQKIPENTRKQLVDLGFLHPNWESVQELPTYVSLTYEDPVIMGRVRVTFPSIETINKMLKK